MTEQMKYAVASLNAAQSQEEFDNIFNYHFKENKDQYKQLLIGYGVDFNRFKKKESVGKSKQTTDEIDIAAMTKMVVDNDKPIVKKSEK